MSVVTLGSGKDAAPWDTPAPKAQHHHHLSGAQKGSAKRWAHAHGMPYPSLVANMHAMHAGKKH